MGPGPQFTLLMFSIKTIIESEKDGSYDFFVESVDKENLFKYQSPICGIVILIRPMEI